MPVSRNIQWRNYQPLRNTAWRSHFIVEARRSCPLMVFDRCDKDIETRDIEFKGNKNRNSNLTLTLLHARPAHVKKCP